MLFRVRRTLFATMIGALVLGVIWCRLALQEALLNDCLTRLGGTVCYNQEGTLIGVTPDSYSYTRNAQSTSLRETCKSTMEAVIISPEAASQIITGFYFSQLVNNPNDRKPISDEQIYDCGEVFTVVSKITIDATLWYEVLLKDSSAWIEASNVILVLTDANIPSATNTPS